MPKLQDDSNDGRLSALLAWLNEDADRAATAYNLLHQKLVQFFEARTETARYATDLADLTIDRAARKLQEEPDLRQRDPISYVKVVARFILLEHLKKPRTASLENDNVPAPEPSDPGRESRVRCLMRCLARLSEQERATVLSYYEHEKTKKIDTRRDAATARGQTSGAFRVQMFRIRRQKLMPCVRRCMEASALRIVN